MTLVWSLFCYCFVFLLQICKPTICREKICSENLVTGFVAQILLQSSFIFYVTWVTLTFTLYNLEPPTLTSSQSSLLISQITNLFFIMSRVTLSDSKSRINSFFFVFFFHCRLCLLYFTLLFISFSSLGFRPINFLCYFKSFEICLFHFSFFLLLCLMVIVLNLPSIVMCITLLSSYFPLLF